MTPNYFSYVYMYRKVIFREGSKINDIDVLGQSYGRLQFTKRIDMHRHALNYKEKYAIFS